MEGVCVSRDVVEVDNGINTGDIEAAGALHAPEGVGTTGQAEQYGGSNLEHFENIQVQKLLSTAASFCW